MLAEIFGHQRHLRWRCRGTKVNGDAIHYILGFTVGFWMCKLLHEEHFTDLFRPDSPHFLCMVKKSRWDCFLFCHKVSICASSVTHLTGYDGGNSPFRSDGQPVGSPEALFVSPTGLWTIWSRHRGFMRVHPQAGWPSCGCECKTLK
jgi:hypothetical protein